MGIEIGGGPSQGDRAASPAGEAIGEPPNLDFTSIMKNQPGDGSHKAGGSPPKTNGSDVNDKDEAQPGKVPIGKNQGER